jgi:pimeloyl-ACP methyl ester carboxylesterase
VAAWWVPARAGDARAHLVVLYFHGSASHLSHELSTLRFLRSLGVATLLVEYPGYDDGTGRPDEAGCYQAAEAGWRHLLEDRGFEPQAVVVFGISLGAALATYLAERERPSGLVVHSAFTSVPDLAAHRYPWLPVKPFCRTRMNNLRRMANCPAPLLVVHSEDDEHTPFRQAIRLYERHPGPKKLMAIHGPHFSNPWQRSGAVRSAWEQLLDGDIAGWERQA